MQIWLIVRAELECWLGQRSTYIYFIVLLLFSFLQVAAFKNGVDGTATNSPFQIHYIAAGMSMFGLPVIAAIAGGSICKEFSNRSSPLTFTTPLRTWQLLFGRFVASQVVLQIVFSSVTVGCFLGTLLPLVQQAELADSHLRGYFQPYAIVLMPNLLFSGAIMFAVAALGRKMIWVYLSAAVLLAVNMTAGAAMGEVATGNYASVLEPFGSLAFVQLAEHATINERNTQLVPLGPVLILNRLVWIAVSMLVLVFTVLRFKLGEREVRSSERVAPRESAIEIDVGFSNTATKATPQTLRLLPTQVTIEFFSIVTRFPFLVITSLLIGVVINAARFLGSAIGTSVHPTTSNLLVLGQNGIDLFVFLTIVIFSGQLVWRERDANTSPLYDPLPLPTWFSSVPKTIALFLVQALLFGIVIICAIAIQAFQGHYDFDLAVYLKAFFGIEWFHACLLSVFAIAVHVVVNHKYLGYFALGIYFAANEFSPRFGVEHHLFRYGSHPGYIYSDISGFGNFVYPIITFNAFWAVLAILLAVLNNCAWVRGYETNLYSRLYKLHERWTRATQLTAATCVVGLIGLGSFIVYNTNFLNEFRSRDAGEKLKVDYEHAFQSFQDLPHPRITSVEAHANLFPAERRLQLLGTFQLANKTSQPVNRILVSVPPSCDVWKLTIGTANQATRIDRRSGSHVYELEAPMQPFENVELTFEFHFLQRGFTNHRDDSSVVENGTYFDASFFPRLGYVAGYELDGNNKRRQFGLPRRKRVAAVDDLRARRNQIKIADADWIDLDLTISTSDDQKAVAPGTLVREWVHDGRRFSHYRNDAPMLYFFPVLSARFEVLRDRWNDVDLEIYFHAGHEFNLAAMMKATKQSLSYYTTNFGPYHNKQLRIVEVPRTHPSAKAFSGLIPFSEGLGFVLKTSRRKANDRKTLFFVTAHEVAHQWWGHQVVGADVQGSFMLTESLAQYAALMVIKQEFGETVSRRILRAELNEYLKGRASSDREEPLALEERQAWIHYHKGSLAMYALQDYLGEDTVNRVLAEYVADMSFQQPPYTTSMELVERFRRATPAHLAYLVDDLFLSITLHDSQAISASYTLRPDGQYEVRLIIEARKYRGTRSVGKEEIPLDEWIDIGITNAAGNFQYLEKHRLQGGSHELVLIVPETPKNAGIDPKNILIDLEPRNNTIPVIANAAFDFETDKHPPPVVNSR